MAGKYRLTTLGCKVNQYESQQIRELLDSLGMQPAPPGETPDVALVNTCAVTASASSKSRRAIRREARNGHTPVVILGCGASADAARLRVLHGVVAVIDHHVDAHTRLRNLLSHWLERTPPSPRDQAANTLEATHTRPDAGRDDVWMIPLASKRAPLKPAPLNANSPLKIMPRDSSAVKTGGELTGTIRRFADHHRAFLKVQDGCDASCTYCIVPRLRGPIRSKPLTLAVAEAAELVRNGHKEIILTGVFLGAYRRDTAIRKRFTTPASPLAELVDAVAQVDGLERLRLSSLEPGDVSETLLAVLASRDSCVPHLHLPLQSGSREVLRRMNRQYNPEAFVEMIDRIRVALDRPAITTDIIVGFPGETEADFQASLELAGYAGFLKIHAFPFSPRQGTAAARWRKDFVHPAEVRERMRRLAAVEQACSLQYRRGLLGHVERVIVEGPAGVGRTVPGLTYRRQRGRADRYFELHFEAENARPGDLVSVRVDRVTAAETFGAVALE